LSQRSRFYSRADWEQAFVDTLWEEARRYFNTSENEMANRVEHWFDQVNDCYVFKYTPPNLDDRQTCRVGIEAIESLIGPPPDLFVSTFYETALAVHEERKQHARTPPQHP
jgi:hypothetical protein